MKSIEFIGPSSIGKSTILNSFSDYSSDASKWITSKDALRKINPKPSNIMERISRKIQRIKKTQKNSKKHDLFKRYNEEIKIITDLFFLALCKDESEPWQKIKLSEYYFNSILKKALLIHHEYRSQKIVLFDEGIVQVGRITYITEEIICNNSLANSEIFPSGIVHLDVDNDTYKKRIKKRFKENGEQRFHKSGSVITPDMLDLHIEHFKATNFKKVEVCKRLNVPVLELEAIHSKENFELLDKFIESIHSVNNR